MRTSVTKISNKINFGPNSAHKIFLSEKKTGQCPVALLNHSVDQV